MEAMQSDKHVLTEKLMAHNVAQCKVMARVSEATNRYLSTGHQRHYIILYDDVLHLIKWVCGLWPGTSGNIATVSCTHGIPPNNIPTLITQDTDRLISRQFAMGVQGLPSNSHYLFQEPMGELLKASLYVRKQWLASTQLARERQKRWVTAQAEKYPKERQFMENWLLRGTG
jgi:hypothetical protein